MNTLKQLEEKIIEEFDEYIPTYIEDFDVGRLEEFLLSALAEQKSEIVKMLQNCKLPVNSISKDGSSTLAYIPNEGFNRELNNRLDFIITNLTKE